MTDRHRIAGLDLDEYRALDGTGDVTGPAGPSNLDITEAFADSLLASQERRRPRTMLEAFEELGRARRDLGDVARRRLEAVSDDVWAAAGGLIIAAGIIIGVILAGR